MCFCMCEADWDGSPAPSFSSSPTCKDKSSVDLSCRADYSKAACIGPQATQAWACPDASKQCSAQSQANQRARIH